MVTGNNQKSWVQFGVKVRQSTATVTNPAQWDVCRVTIQIEPKQAP